MVESRDAETLLAFIRNYVAEGSNTITDKWKAYNKNDIEGHTKANHDFVNHSRGFKNILTGAHPNTVEGKS